MNDASFASDLSAHVAWTQALARQLVRDGAEAEDVAQEALLRALEHPPRDPGALRGFLRRVLGNVRAERGRSVARRAARERVAARDEVQPAADELAERLAWQRRLVDAVERLEEPFRTAVLLRFFESLPPRAIAARLGVPVKTVDSRLQRGLERLRAELDREKGGRRGWALALCGLLRPESQPVPRVLALRWALVAGLAVVAFWSGRRFFVPATAVEPVVLVSAESGEPEAAVRAATPPVERREPFVGSTAKTGRVAGRVLGADGAPLAGAHVELLEPPFAGFDLSVMELRRLAPRLAETVTTSDGAFAFEAPERTPLLVRAGAIGLGPEELQDVHAGDRLELALERAGRFEVQASFPESPCAGAGIELLRQGVDAPVWKGVTDEQGRVEATGLARGIYIVECAPRDGTRAFVLDVALAAGGEASTRFDVERGVELTGTVRAARSGRPLGESARVSVKGTRSGPVTTDARGEFRLRGLPMKFPSWTVDVTAEGYAPASQELRATDAPEELRFELEPELRLSGTAVDPEGRAIGGAWVACGSRGVRSDEQGRIELGGLAPGGSFVVLVRARGHGSWVGTSVDRAGEVRRDLGRITLGPATSLAGRVRTDAGKALAGVGVELQRISSPESTATQEPAGAATLTIVARAPAAIEPPVDRELGVELERAGRRRARSNAQGDFRFDDLAPGHYRLLARKNGYGATPPREVELAQAGQDGVELVFEEGLAVSGTVRGSDGLELANAWLVVRAPANAAASPVQLSALDGRFVLRGLPPGPIELDVSYHQYDGQGEPLYLHQILRDLVAPRADLEVVLPRNRPIEGRVLDASGRPLAGYLVRAEIAEGHTIDVASDAEGRFRISAAEGSTVDLELGGPAAGDPGEARAADARPRYEARRAAVPAGSTGIELRAIELH